MIRMQESIKSFKLKLIMTQQEIHLKALKLDFEATKRSIHKRIHIWSSRISQHNWLEPLVKQLISMKPGQCNIWIFCPGQNDEWFNLIDSCDAVYSRNLTFTNSIDHFTLSRAVGFSFFFFLINVDHFSSQRTRFRDFDVIYQESMI